MNRTSELAALDDQSARDARPEWPQNFGEDEPAWQRAIQFDPGFGLKIEDSGGMVEGGAGQGAVKQGAVEQGSSEEMAATEDAADAAEGERQRAEGMALLRKLTPQQHKALDMLWDGRGVRAAAEAAGVGRSTLYRWFRSDKAFAYAYYTWQADVIETARRRLVGLSEMAVETLARAMNDGDANVALKVLKSVGAMKKRTRRKTVL